MAANEKVESYYNEKVDLVINKLKSAFEKTLDVIDKSIDEDLADDKYLNVLKARRQASEDATWMLRKIDELENEKNGTVAEETEKTSGTPTNMAKKFASKQ
jgi:hypothetical protein